jgi:hypothetical protein
VVPIKVVLDKLHVLTAQLTLIVQLEHQVVLHVHKILRPSQLVPPHALHVHQGSIVSQERHAKLALLEVK